MSRKNMPEAVKGIDDFFNLKGRGFSYGVSTDTWMRTKHCFHRSAPKGKKWKDVLTEYEELLSSAIKQFGPRSKMIRFDPDHRYSPDMGPGCLDEWHFMEDENKDIAELGSAILESNGSIMFYLILRKDLIPIGKAIANRARNDILAFGWGYDR